LSGRGLCDELITRPEESYRLCCVVVCDLETSRIDAPYIYDISNLRVKLSETDILYTKPCFLEQLVATDLVRTQKRFTFIYTEFQPPVYKIHSLDFIQIQLN